MIGFSANIEDMPSLLDKAKARREDILKDKKFILFHLHTIEGLFKQYQEEAVKGPLHMFSFAEMLLSYIIVLELHEKLIIKVQHGEDKNDISYQS